MSNLLQVTDLSKSYSGQVVLDAAAFSVGAGKKIAVIGRNGAGKSTLFKIITGQEEADSGNLIFSAQTRLGYLKQEDDFQENDTVLSYLQRKSDVEEWRCAKAAAQFELKDEKLEALVSTLSGGYQMRVKLASMLLLEPNLILLDEPTNYLDLSTTLLLEKFLRSYRGTYLVISHDRNFIKNTCTEVLELEWGKAYYFPNSLEHYFEYKEKKLETDLNFNKKQEKKKQHLQQFVDRFGAKASKASQAKSKLKQIERLETIQIQSSLAGVRMKIHDVKAVHGFVWRLKDLAIGYGSKVVAGNIDLDLERGSHVSILGDNGQGKSTFLKTLAERIEPVSGSYKKLEGVKVAYYAQHVMSEMGGSETVKQYLERAAQFNILEEEIFKMAGNFLFRDDDLKKPISILSGGEKARLCLAGILLNTYDVLLLDEPTSHLDFETVEVLARSLAGTNVAVLFVSHDRDFIKILAERILEVKNGTIKHFYGDFDDYIEYLQKNSNQETDEAKARTPRVNVNHRKSILAEEKMKKRELERIEKMIDSLKKDREEILKMFAENPTKINLSLDKRRKTIELEIKQWEEKWFELSVHI
ncbi:TPA: hypothetical protein DF272_00745 [Candidatus Falkowbacteria bacterium]|nr:hypothetical protein [Candidatus Falkowbacteria bacterium]